MTEFAIHTDISIKDMSRIKQFLYKTITKEELDLDEIKEVIGLVEKIDSLVIQFNKEGEKS